MLPKIVQPAMQQKGPWVRRAAALAVVFALAFAVRSLYAVDQAGDMYSSEQTGTRMAQRYDDTAVQILAGEGILWPRVRDRERTGLLSRPPGYALYLVAVYGTLGRSFFATQLVQNVLTSLCCVLLVLVAARLAAWPIGLVAGLLAALSPQLGFVSALVLPDGLTALPLLLALLILARAHPDRDAPWWTSAAAGALLGAAVWLRPDVVLLPPLLSLTILLVSRQRVRGLVHALALSLAAVAVVIPITIRNYVVFDAFVPVSINGGLTLWEGTVDAGGREAGARRHDTLVAEEEAVRYDNPGYLAWWAEPDGIWRDRDRYRRAVEVIRANPGRFARLMLDRMARMLDYASGEAAFVLVEAAAPPALDRTLRRRAGAPPAPRNETRFLAPGRAAAPLRPLVAALQPLLCAVLLPLLIPGTLVLAWRDWRRALLLLAVSLYYLLSESPFIYHWRVVTAMHYGLFAAAAAALVAAAAIGSRIARGRSSGERGTD